MKVYLKGLEVPLEVAHMPEMKDAFDTIVDEARSNTGLGMIAVGNYVIEEDGLDLSALELGAWHLKKDGKYVESLGLHRQKEVIDLVASFKLIDDIGDHISSMIKVDTGLVVPPEKISRIDFG